MGMGSCLDLFDDWSFGFEMESLPMDSFFLTTTPKAILALHIGLISRFERRNEKIQ